MRLQQNLATAIATTPSAPNPSTTPE